MATAPECLVLCLDVSPTMGAPHSDGSPSYLESAVKAIDLIIQNKVLHSKKDEVGLLLFGTSTTDNALDGDGQYQNISVVRPISLPDLQFLRIVENSIVPSKSTACFVDALVVGMDMLVTKTKTMKKADMRLVLFTDAASEFNGDQVGDIIAGLKGNDIAVQIIGVDADDAGGAAHAQTPRQREGIQLLKHIVDSVDGQLFSFDHALRLVSQFRKHTVKQVTVFRGCLEIGDLKVPVWGYSRQRRATAPTFKKLSGHVAYDPSNPDSGKVNMVRTYHLNDDNSTEIQSDERARGYKFGRDVVPYQEADNEMFKLLTEKRLAVLCFTQSANIPRHHYMGGSVVSFAPPPGDAAAATALSAIAEDLYEMDKVAVVRYVWRANSAPKLGILLPHVKSDYVSLLFVQIPFREDVRMFQFPSLNTKKAAPTPAQQAAMDALVDKMDLMTAWADDDGAAVEALQPKLTFNPVIQHIYQCVHHRAMNPGAPIPALDEMIAKYVRVPELLSARAEAEAAAVKAAFPTVRKAERARATAARLWQQTDTTGDAEQASKRARQADDDADISVTSLLRGDVTQVGALTPVEDYVAMVTRRTEDLLKTASEQLMSRIDDVVDMYIAGPTGNFLPMVAALRTHLVRDEPAMFNAYLQKLCGSLRQQPAQRRPFLDALQGAGITLISSAENTDSPVTPEEAAAFWAAAPAPAPAVPAAPVVDDADLLDEL